MGEDSDDEQSLFVRQPSFDIHKGSIELDNVPKKNRYIKKMRKIGKQIENTNPFDVDVSR